MMVQHLNGFMVFETADALEGMKQVRSKMPDLVIMDLSLPGFWVPGNEADDELDRHLGLKICRMIKFDARIRHIPILVLTSSDSVEDFQHAVQCGADGYLLKTASSEYLISEINRLMEGGEVVMTSGSSSASG